MAKIYRKRGNKLNEVVTFDSACTRQENQPLVYDATDGSVHTTTHINCLDANDLSVNNLTVTGQAIIQEQVTDTIDSNTLVLRSNADAGLTGTENSGVIIHNYNGSEDLYAVTDNTGTFRVGTAVSTTTTHAYLRYNKTDNKWYSTAPGVTPVVEVTPVGSPTSWDSVVTSGDDVEYTNIVFSVIDRTSLQPLTTRNESTAMEADYLTKWNATNEKIITTGTSCTHDLCANGNITSTGNITAKGNVCVKTNITVDGKSCVKGNSTVSGEIHSCKCITAPTACVSDDLYVAGDINNCNTNSIIHGYYGCFENNVCIKGDLAIDGVATLPGLVSDCVASVENTKNSSFYLPFVKSNHLVKGANDLYTNGDLQYNPSTDVLCTKTFRSDRGIVQSAFSNITAANLGLTANTAYDLSTIVSCLQACYGDKAVSYSFIYSNANAPKVTEYGNNYAYNLTFEKLDNSGVSGAWTKTRWLVTGSNGVSWTVTGTADATAGDITWTVREHVVDQVCVATASNNQDFPLIFSNCQSTPSCSKKTLYTDSANNLMYNPSTNTLKTCCISATCLCGTATCVNTTATALNANYYLTFVDSNNATAASENVYTNTELYYNPSTNTLKTCCICACCDSYHARIKSPNGNTLYAAITLNPDSLGENTAHLTFDVYGTKFELGVREIASTFTKMSITYFTKTGDYGIKCANVINANNKTVVYIKYSGYRVTNITSDIPIKSITTSSTAPSDVSSTSWCEPTYDNATQYVNVTDTNCNFPILFNSCQATPAAGCKTLYNDSANNLMYNPSTNTLTTCCICGATKITEGNPTGCTSSVTGQPGSILQNGAFELYDTTPFIDFHVNNASASYSHRIIAYANCLRVLASNATGSTANSMWACYDFTSDGSLCITCAAGTASLIARSKTSSTPLTGLGPRVVFQNTDASKNGCLVFTDYDTYLSGASLTFATDQPTSWFCSQYIKSATDVTCSLRLYHCATATNWQSLACVSFGTVASGGSTHCPFIFAACPNSNGINIAFGQNAQTIIYAGESAQTNFANFITQNGAGEKVVLVSDDNAADIVLDVNGGITGAKKWCFTSNIERYFWNGTTYSRLAAFRPISNNVLSIDQGDTSNSISGANMFVAGQTNTVRATNTVVIGQLNTNGSASTSTSNVIMIGNGNDASYNNVSRSNVILIGSSNFDCSTTSWNTTLGFCNINYGQANVSIGYGHKTYDYAIAIGDNNVTGKYNTTCAEGIRIGHSTVTSTTGTCSIAIGTNAVACGYDSVAIGSTAKANATDSIVIGDNACASVNGDSAVVIGQEACGLREAAVAIGALACSCENAVAIGANTFSEEGSTAIGYYARTGGHGFLALGKCANSYICQNVSDIYFRFPYSTTIEIDDPLYGRHGHIKFVIPSCSQDRDITNFLNCLFVREINMGRCKCTWSASSCCNVPTLVAHLSGFYWDDGGSSDNYQRWAPGVNGRGNINELILLNTSAGSSSNLSVYDLIVTCGKNICTDSWNWGTGTGIWSCGMVGTIEF